MRFLGCGKGKKRSALSNTRNSNALVKLYDDMDREYKRDAAVVTLNIVKSMNDLKHL